MNIKGHFKTITRHKILVTKTCFKVGLYKQGILHDLSKYSPKEFIPGCRYYQGFRSPIAREKEINGVSMGWLHHKGKYPHHFEYWLDIDVNTKQIQGMKMKKKYVAEMCIDRICASKNYQNEKYTDESALIYYLNGKDKTIMHPETAFLLEYLLRKLADQGEDVLFRYMKKVLLKNREGDYHVVDGKLILD